VLSIVVDGMVDVSVTVGRLLLKQSLGTRPVKNCDDVVVIVTPF
jgi:hypothetical protein